VFLLCACGWSLLTYDVVISAVSMTREVVGSKNGLCEEVVQNSDCGFNECALFCEYRFHGKLISSQCIIAQYPDEQCVCFYQC